MKSTSLSGLHKRSAVHLFVRLIFYADTFIRYLTCLLDRGHININSGWFFCLAPNGARRTESHITKKTNTKNDICLNRLNYFCSGENHCRNDGVYFLVDNNEKRGKSYDFLFSQIDTSNLSGYLLFIFSFF